MALNFIWLDWAMIVAFLLLTTGIAFMTRRLISNYDSFLLAGRSPSNSTWAWRQWAQRSWVWSR